MAVEWTGHEAWGVGRVRQRIGALPIEKGLTRERVGTRPERALGGELFLLHLPPDFSRPL